MIKKIIVMVYCILPLLANSQEKNGIKFQTFANWQQVLIKAKSEHKKIFMDAYATWCGPCKEMDDKVYSDKEIGDYVDTNFIAVKIQFDQTNKDSEQIKSWYSEAKFLSARYQIEALPTFMFFNESGELLHRTQGYQDVENFSATLRKAIDPMQNYPGQVRRFKIGVLQGIQLLQTAILAKEYREDSLANRMAVVYKNTVLEKSHPSKIINSNLVDFIVNFHPLMSINDRLSKYLYHHMTHADSLFGSKGYSKKVISYLIVKDMIDPAIKINGKYKKALPNWNQLEKSLAKIFDPNIAHTQIIEAKIGWYKANEDWENLVKYHIEKIERDRIVDGLYLNSVVFNVIFAHSNNPEYLKKGVGYMETALKGNPDKPELLDTYANILYKMGQKDDALTVEKKALQVAEMNNDAELIKIFKEIIEKINSNHPTWQY